MSVAVESSGKNTTKKTDQCEDVTKKVVPNWKQRVKFGLLIFSSFSLILYEGSLALALTIFMVQLMCFKEILNISHDRTDAKSTLTAWYFFAVWNYCLIGETFGKTFDGLFVENRYLLALFEHCRFKSFCLYFSGLVIFVAGLKRDNRRSNESRFRLLAVLHVLFLVLTVPTYLLLRCLFEGMIWVVVPILSVTLNDIFAYLFGKLMGRTPLIHVSPNKTWEGFVGGAVGTIATTLALSSSLSRFGYFTCPTEFDAASGWVRINGSCAGNFMFEGRVAAFGGFEVGYVQFDVAALYIALFASSVAPFAGFFASGFKRAFNVKDFSDIIPGHGGILDRFDCQFLMAIFVYVYISTFVKETSYKKLFGKIQNLKYDDRVAFFELLKSSLSDREML